MGKTDVEKSFYSDFMSLKQVVSLTSNIWEPNLYSDFGHTFVSEQVIILRQMSGLKLVLLYCMPSQGILE